ncbi:MAG: Lar family restriction alleviation protein [Clostridia bacterium]|nr:Lar family restriction alleviation protein [Clostridia bacterium]
MSELKPCPFCGGKAQYLSARTEERSGVMLHTVCCTVCGASTRTCSNRQLACAVWSRRVQAGYERKELPFGARKGDGTDAIFCGPAGDLGPAEVTAVLSEREEAGE